MWKQHKLVKIDVEIQLLIADVVQKPQHVKLLQKKSVFNSDVQYIENDNSKIGFINY